MKLATSLDMSNFLPNTNRLIFLLVILTIVKINQAQFVTTFGFQPVQSEAYNYVDGTLSLKVEKIHAHSYVYSLYNKSEHLVYSINKEIPAGGSMSIKPFFRSDGSVESITTSFNPGASKYSYSRVITLDNNNTPIKLVNSQIPCDDFKCEKILFWNKDKLEWEKSIL